MPQSPKFKLLPLGPDLPMAERVANYQHNIRGARAAGFHRVSSVPSPSDTLDPKEIEAWFVRCAATSDRPRTLIGQLARLLRPAGAKAPSSRRSR